MPVIITKDSTSYYLVPSPLISFSRETYNNVGRPALGATFTITLEGTLVPEKGNPYYNASADEVLLSTADWTKEGGGADSEPSYGSTDKLSATLKKQEKIRFLFSNNSGADGAQPIMVNITNWGETTGGLKFAAIVESVEFSSEGRGVLPGTYTVTLKCDTFLESANDDFAGGGNEFAPTYAVTNAAETFDIAEDDRLRVLFKGNDYASEFKEVDKLYTVSRSISAVGAPRYDSDGAYVSGEPWEQASGFVYNILGTGFMNMPTARHDFTRQLGGGLWKSANRSISESVDKEAGSYSVQETFTAYTGDPVIHTISVSRDTAENERQNVSVQGTIQGLNTADPLAGTGNAFINALSFNEEINPTGEGVIPSGYFYGRNLAGLSWLHPMPRSKSIAKDLVAGTISYSYNFDDRPPNLVSGSVSEVISINDTYPGELFSATPVIGRNQPILQYLNSRSEYRRTLNINLTMGSMSQTWGIPEAGSGYWAGAGRADIQQWLLNDKPSRLNMSSGDLAVIFQAANPVNDPSFNVRTGKCFHSAPSESWDPYSRSYSYSIEWTYEREV